MRSGRAAALVAFLQLGSRSKTASAVAILRETSHITAGSISRRVPIPLIRGYDNKQGGINHVWQHRQEQGPAVRHP